MCVGASVGLWGPGSATVYSVYKVAEASSLPVMDSLSATQGMIDLMRATVSKLKDGILASLMGPNFPGKGTSAQYCQQSVIQWNFISKASRYRVTHEKR